MIPEFGTLLKFQFVYYVENSKIYDKKTNKKTYGAPGPTLNPFDFGFCPSLALAPLIVGLV